MTKTIFESKTWMGNTTDFNSIEEELDEEN